MLCRRITPVLVWATVTLLAAQAISYKNNGTSCNLVIPSLLVESGINSSDLVRCGDRTVPTVPLASRCPINIRNSILCTSPIVIRRHRTNRIEGASNSSNGSFAFNQSFSECLTYKKRECTRTFHLFTDEIREIPERFDFTSIHPTIAKDTSLISLAHCNPGYIQSIFCDFDSDTVIDQASSSLLDLLKRYITDNERKIVIGMVIVYSSCALEYQINSFEPSVVEYLTFNSSLEGMISYSVFSRVPQLKKVRIQSLNFNYIPPDLFLKNNKLIDCVITQTMVEEVHPELFTSAIELEVVDLSDNRLQTLPGNLFQNNVRLITLVLARNQIRFLPTNFLAHCHNLSTLDLRYNRLQALELYLLTNPPETTYVNFTKVSPVPSTFAKRYRSWLADEARLSEVVNATIRTNSLVKIYLTYNQFEKIPRGLFDGSTILTIFRADHNAKLEHLEGSHSFYALQEFSASNCSIRRIDEDFFAKRFDNAPLFVKKIDLSRNKLEGLHRRTFWNCKELEILLLSRNRLLKLESGLFKDLVNLTVLDVSGNMLSTIQPEALRLRNILHLDFSWNQIDVFQPEKLISLFEKSNSGFAKRIDLSHNCLTRKKIILPSINDTQKLYIKYLNIRYTPLEPNDTVLDGKRFLIDVEEVRRRQGGKFGYENARNEVEQLVLSLKLGPTEEGVSLCPNLFKKFCTHFPLACRDTTNATTAEVNEKLRYLNFSGCEQLSVEDDYIEDAIKCPFTPKCPAPHYRFTLSHVTGHYDRDSSFNCPITTSCPSPCRCYKRAIENEIVVNCSRSGLSQFPKYIPPHTKILYFNNNQLHTLVGLNSSVSSELRELYLENNLISSIEKEYLPPKLKRVSLKNNKIESFDKADLDALSDIEVYLSGNPWKCDCNALLLKAQLQVLAFVPDAESVLCASSNMSILNTPDDVLCPENLQVAQHISLAVSLGIILPLVAGILILLYYRNKELVKAFIFTKFPIFFKLSRDLGGDKKFDAFISYSTYDRDVAMQMIEELENKEPYFRLCIHERDWMPGNPITANIAKSVSCSRKTVFIVSMDFIRSMWFPVELNAAYNQMLQDKKNSAIIIIKGDLPPKGELDDHLQILLKTKTYLVWGEHWFWEKLRYALYRNTSNECPMKSNMPDSDFIERIEKDVRNMEVNDTEV